MYNYLKIRGDRFEGSQPFNTQHNITTTHVYRKHVSFQMVILHFQFNILTTTTTFHHTPISYENVEVVNKVNKNMESHILGPTNEVMGASTIYKHYQLLVFNVALDFGSLRGRNS